MPNLFQAKIARLAKKFGEANQSSENKTKEVGKQKWDRIPILSRLDIQH